MSVSFLQVSACGRKQTLIASRGGCRNKLWSHQPFKRRQRMTPQEVLKHSDTGDLWPTSGDCDCNEVSSAYETALAVRALRVARGELPEGYKIGFTNRTIWSRYNVFAPIWGSMWNTTITHCNGAGVVSLARLCQPRIEPEVVFGIRATPRANSSLEELFEALEWAAPWFEIVQSHAPNWVFTAPQTVVDGGHVLEMTPDLAPSEILDLRAHGFDAKAVAAALINAAIPGSRSRRRASCSSAHCNVF